MPPTQDPNAKDPMKDKVRSPKMGASGHENERAGRVVGEPTLVHT